MEINKIYNENNLDTMKGMSNNCIDSIVTDPPYGISFMGKKWDYDVPRVEVWKECLRVLKPGGHALIACGTKTQHRMAVNIEDAGFEIRDIVAWVYGSGFPKSLNIGKAVDKLQGNEREITGYAKSNPDLRDVGRLSKEAIGIDKLSFGQAQGAKRQQTPIDKGSSPYEGWGTALKPAMELWTLCRKPLEEKTVAANVLKWGTGGINIDGCRIGMTKQDKDKSSNNWKPNGYDLKNSIYEFGTKIVKTEQPQGRFPANLIHDGSQMILDLFPDSKSGAMKKHYEYINNGNSLGKPTGSTKQIHEASSGSAARFFYVAKASKSERNEGLEGFEEKQTVGGGGGIGDYKNDVNSMSGKYGSEKAPQKNNHPTVKPIKLMKYLCRLITPSSGLIYDPFAGSGSTGKAAIIEGFKFIGSEISKKYCDIANKRIKF